jgi:copper chaperone CopZ
MHCESCAEDIRETLEETAGVRSAEVNYGGKTAWVEYDSEVVQETTLVKKIQDLGYNATRGDHEQQQQQSQGAH